MGVIAVAVVSVVATAALLGAGEPVVNPNPTILRPQEVGELGSFSTFTEDSNYGRAIPPDGTVTVVGQDGSVWLTSTSGANLANPVELPSPSGAGASYGSAVNLVRTTKQNSPTSLDGAGQTFFWVAGAASATNTVYVQNNIGFEPDPSNDSLTINVNLGVNGYDDSQALTPSGAPGGTYTPSTLLLGPRESDPGACMFADLNVVYTSGSGGYIVKYKYDGLVPTEVTGDFTQVQLISNNAAGFGASAARSIRVPSIRVDRIVVGAPGASRAYLYSDTTDDAACTTTLALMGEMSPAADGGSFGDSISIGRSTRGPNAGNYQIAVGAPTRNNFGEVDLFALTSDGTDPSLLQTITAPTDTTMDPPVSPVAGMRFGDAVATAETNFLLIGAPSYSANGGLFFFQLNETSGDLEFEFPLNLSTTAVPDSAVLGGIITLSCRTFSFGVPTADSVMTQNLNIGAFYDEYCTCQDVAAETGRFFASFVSGTPASAVCDPEQMVRNRLCLLEDAPNLCRYVNSPAWFFTEDLPDNPTGQQFSCVEDERIRRDIWVQNCFYDYGTVGTANP